METVSKKRGRPKAFSDEELASAMTSGCKTLRGRQNFAYTTRATWMLGSDNHDEALYAHFLPSYNDVMSGRKTYSMTLLSEIGRLPFDDMPIVAREICDRKLSTKDAIAFVRQLRIGHKPKQEFSQFELIKVIADAIDGYTACHEASTDQLLCTLESISEIISENQEDAQ